MTSPPVYSASPNTPLATAAVAKDPALRKAAQGFEAVFLRELISTMREAKLAEDIFGSSATDNFRELADANLADSMADMGQFGIAEMIEKQFAGLYLGSDDTANAADAANAAGTKTDGKRADQTGGADD